MYAMAYIKIGENSISRCEVNYGELQKYTLQTLIALCLTMTHKQNGY